MKFLTSAILALTVASGSAFAQAPAPSPTPAPAVKAPSAPVVTLDAATEAKFKSVDKDNSGVLDGAEVTAYKADMAKIDADKDGKVSRAEFAAAVKGGIIK